MTINIINKSMHKSPMYATEGSSGMDLRANEDFVLKPLERRLVPTGIYVQLPEGYEAQVRPRSGLAINMGVTVLNTPGTIDADYRGEICVVLVNLSNEDFSASSGERIAQMVITKVEHVDVNVVVKFDDETERGEGAFGHTGTK